METVNSNNHPTFARLSSLANKLGSKATTSGGVARFFRKRTWHLGRYGGILSLAVIDFAQPESYRIPLTDYDIEFVGVQHVSDTSNMTGTLQSLLQSRRDRFVDRQREEFTKDRSKRLVRNAKESWREICRAREDKVFRRKYLSRLRRREESVLRREPRYGDGEHRIEAVLAMIEDRSDRQAVLDDIGSSREQVIGESKTKRAPAAPRTVRLSIDEVTAEAAGAKICRRGKNWGMESTYVPTWHDHSDGVTHWDRGRAVGYDRAENCTYVRSMAHVDGDHPQVVWAVIHDTHVRVELPAGYSWNIDEDRQLRLYRDDSNDNDYHPDAGDFLRDDPAVEMIDQLEENRGRRSVYRSSSDLGSDGVYVCFSDSVAAGNCPSGTKMFARRAGLNSRSHISVSRLQQITKKLGADVSGRVSLAINAAILRHRSEMGIGCCEVSYHS